MAAPLTKENREKIVDYLESLDLSELTGNQIKELIKENLGINVSQPTASKLKAEIMSDSLDEDESDGDSSLLGCPELPEELCEVETIKPENVRQLSEEQMNAVENLLQGKSEQVVAETIGVSRQTLWEWRNHDPLFIAEVNRRRVESWGEACERMKSLANRALDVLELQLGSDDPKTSLAAAKYVLQGTQLLGDTNLRVGGPTNPREIILEKLRRDARKELAPKLEEIRNSRNINQIPNFDFNDYECNRVEEEIEALAKSRLKKALEEAGLA